MPQALEPCPYLLKTVQHQTCQIPLSSMDKCLYKTCEQVDPPLPLQKFDRFWSEFLKAQQESSANYLYNFKIYGDSKDPTLEHKEPIEESYINRRLLHLPYVGGLFKGDMFYLLSFILNLMKLEVAKQKEYMDYLLEQGFMDKEILNYLQILARQTNTGLSPQQLKEFQGILKFLMDKEAAKQKEEDQDLNFYNAQHIFLKTPHEINPYELEYLRNITQGQNKLNLEQTIYLANFVNYLQQMEETQRENYMKTFYDNRILPFSRFETLEIFMRVKSKRVKTEKLKILLIELLKLMDLKSCLPQLQPEPPKKPITYEEIQVDYIKIHKAFKHLMKAKIPNIVRLTDLQYFLNSLLLLQPVQIVGVLQSLKFANVLYAQRFDYMEKFINSRHFTKVDKMKKRMLVELIKKVASEPVAPEALIKLDIPAGKGPPVEKIEKKAAPAEGAGNKEETEVKKEEDRKKGGESKVKADKKKCKKSSKKGDKKAKKKAGKKKTGKKKK